MNGWATLAKDFTPGKRAFDMPTCQHCAADGRPGATYCTACGAGFTTAAAPPAAPTPAAAALPTAPRSVRVVGTLCIIGGALGVSMAVLSIAFVILFGTWVLLVAAVGFALSAVAVAAGKACLKGKPWARVGTIGVLAVAALAQLAMKVPEVARYPTTLLDPYLMASIGLAVFTLHAFRKPDALAWFGRAAS